MLLIIYTGVWLNSKAELSVNKFIVVITRLSYQPTYWNSQPGNTPPDWPVPEIMPLHVRWEVRGAFFYSICAKEARKRKGLPSDLYNLVSRLLLHQTYILYWAALEIMSSSFSCLTPCILCKLDNFLIAKVKTNHSFQLLFDFILIQNVAHSYSFCFKPWIDRLKNEKHF